MRVCGSRLVFCGGLGCFGTWVGGREGRTLVEVWARGVVVVTTFPRGLTCENPETGCVCVVWAYPGRRADDSVFSPSW